MRLFYRAFPIHDALRHELGGTHYRLLLKVENEAARAGYLAEAIAEHWSTRAWEQRINPFTMSGCYGANYGLLHILNSLTLTNKNTRW